MARSGAETWRSGAANTRACGLYLQSRAGALGPVLTDNDIAHEQAVRDLAGALVAVQPPAGRQRWQRFIGARFHVDPGVRGEPAIVFEALAAGAQQVLPKGR